MNVPNAPAPQATPASGAPAPAPAPAAPEPGSPEHKAAMIAAYDAQFAAPEAKPTVNGEATKTPEELAAEEAAKTTKTPEEIAAEAEASKSAKTPEELAAEDAAKAGTPPVLADLVDSGDFFAGLGADTVPEALTAALVAAGLKAEQVPAINERLKQLLKAEATLQTQGLHKVAGGEAEFSALIAWGKANFTPEQAAFYDAQLNGPNAAEVIELLKVKAAKGTDPKLVQANGSAVPSTQGYRSQAEMQRDMRDPRYQTDPAFRADVRQKLKYATY